MVSSSLLAEVDMKLREVIVDVNPYKKSGGGHAYPFGGLNVLLCGDLWQLPPPGGGFLGNIPAEFIAKARKYIPSVIISHGQSLLWGGIENAAWAFHGITELEESEAAEKTLGCKRCNWSYEKDGFLKIAMRFFTENPRRCAEAGQMEQRCAAMLDANSSVKIKQHGTQLKLVRKAVTVVWRRASNARE